MPGGKGMSMKIKRIVIDLFDMDPKWQYKMNKAMVGWKEVYLYRISHRHVVMILLKEKEHRGKG